MTASARAARRLRLSPAFRCRSRICSTSQATIALKNGKAATRDAPAVARLRAAGFIPIGRTNMTEFAFSGLGINPHYGTPLNAHDRGAGRIPGGSSSGAAVSITDGMAFGALGSDTGGSCRIPAALCGIVGFKPTAHRVPTAGAFPLSTSLDSIGPLAATVACCAALDAVLAGEPAVDLPPFPLAGLRLALPQTMVLENVDTAHIRVTCQMFGRVGTDCPSYSYRRSTLTHRGGWRAPGRRSSSCCCRHHSAGPSMPEAIARLRPVVS